MSEQTKKVALPAYLPKRMEAFKIVKEGQPSYLLRDKLLNRVHDLEPWQFFILEVLPGCETYPKLQSVFEDRFARPISEKEIQLFFASLADRQLLDMESPTHGLLQPFRTKGYEVKDGQATVKSHQAAVEGAAPAPVEAAVAVQMAAAASKAAPQGDLPAGMNDAVGFDPRATRWMLKLFNPTGMLKLLSPVVKPLRFVIYVLPLLLLAAVMLSLQYSHLIREDLSRLHGATTLLEHMVFSMFTINLAVTLTVAFLAHAYRGTVSAIGISVFLGFLPRFVAQVTHVEQLSRRERMWLQGGPLLVRLAVFSLGVLLWYNTRDTAGVLPKVGLALAIICAFDLLFVSGNPLVKGSAYQLLSAFINEPHLRGKSYKTLLNRLRGQSYKASEGSLLAAYALASSVYAFFLIAVVVIVVGVYLQTLLLGGTALIIAGVLGLYLVSRSIRRLQLIEAAYERSVRFDRWRKRTLPNDTGEAEDELKPASAWGHYLKLAGACTALLVLMLPYGYEPGGRFSVFPNQRQVITTDVAGVVQDVRFEGGENIRKGTVIAVLSTADLQAQVSVQNARLAEQVAVIAELRARPKIEDVKLAERALEVAQERERFSKGKATRLEPMYKEGVISFEELDAARRDHLVDVSQVAEKKAALDLARTGAPKDQIEAAVARLQSITEERDLLQSKVGRANLTMPFDGNLLTLHLKDKTNSYLDVGAPFAAVENTADVTVEIEVAEGDIGYIQPGSPVRLRAMSYNDRVFTGKILTIDRNVTVQSFGTVFKVIAVVHNPDRALLTGMTGQAKIEGGSMPVWKAFTMAVQRFVTVQAWSWIP
ncbi:HlyD family secretion protein [Ideonella sp.]|uniref:HlyD family secretion protein n=1 Tax=Ideonella sp. TaxID=1929293 RepID=UPI003BB59F35